MNNDSDQNSRDSLLDAILRADAWEPASAAAKAAALRELAALRRRRQWLATATVALAACLTAAVIWPTLPSSPHLESRISNLASSPPNSALLTPHSALPSTLSSSQPETQNSKLETSASADPAPVRHITEAQMLALFPKGSCLIAEINGQEQLVFFDHQIETQGAPYHPGS